MRTGIKTCVVVATLVVVGLGITWGEWAGVIREGERVYIVDRTGERWDVSQAATLGFNPNGFQYGIGRDAIRPLDESRLADAAGDLHADTRVIGVENGPDAHAYVVRTLTRHEIANTDLGDAPHRRGLLTAGGSRRCVQPAN